MDTSMDELEEHTPDKQEPETHTPRSGLGASSDGSITPRGKVGRRISEIVRNNKIQESPDDESQDKENTIEEQEDRPPTAEDINNCTVQQLRSWLTRRNVEFPQSTQAKQYYVDLLTKSYGMVSIQAKKAKGGKKPPRSNDP